MQGATVLALYIPLYQPENTEATSESQERMSYSTNKMLQEKNIVSSQQQIQHKQAQVTMTSSREQSKFLEGLAVSIPVCLLPQQRNH